MNDKVELLAREGINPFDQHDGGEPPSYEFGNGSRSNDFPQYRQPPQTTPSNVPTIPQSSAIQYPMAFFVAPPQPASGEPQPNVSFLQSSSVLRNQTQQAKRRSFLLPMLISCFVVWFCGFAFGIIAFVLAMFGQDAAYRGDENRAQRCSKLSLTVSAAGIVIGILIVIILCSVLGHQTISLYSCPHGHYMHSGRKICCESVSTCTHGVHPDANGCLQCCEQYSKTECFLNGYYNDSHGCKMCCRVSKDSCNDGFYRDSFGCPKCCYNQNGYSNNYVCMYGSYNDSNGCQQCCNYFSQSDCYGNGFYQDLNGCKRCCPSNDYGCLLRGYTLNENGCKRCCIGNSGVQSTECNCTNKQCDNGYRNDTECKTCCSVKKEDCGSSAFYTDSTGCIKCCDTYCSYGHYMSPPGCMRCCNTVSYYHCDAYGTYNDPVTGCRSCCDVFNNQTCTTNGFYRDSKGCKKCCSTAGMSCTNGFYYDSNKCPVCCDQYDPRNCTRWSDLTSTVQGRESTTPAPGYTAPEQG